MPPKKAPAKKAPAAKKAGTTKKATAAKKATPKKATPKKPTGVVKEKTPSKTASAVKKSTRTTEPPKSTRPKPTREIFGDILKSQSQIPYSPDTDVSVPLKMGNECERAAEIFRLYGGAAVEACGYDQTVLLNACLNLAWDESARSIDPDGGWRYTDGSQESRFGLCDLNHHADWLHWTRQMSAMERAMKELLVKDQTERQKAFSAVGNQYFATKYKSAAEEKKWRDKRELALYYKNNPDEGNTVAGQKSSPVKKAAAAAATKTKKTPVKKAAPASTTKKTPTKKTPVKKSSTVKKSAAKSTTKAGVKKTRTLAQ